jgi:hypothetical protein
LTAAKTNGTTAINGAATTGAVTTALTNAKAAIDAIKSDATLAAEAALALANAKSAAIEALNEYYAENIDIADYIANGAQFAIIIANGTDSINGAATIGAVTTALTNAKAAIDAVETDAEVGEDLTPGEYLALIKAGAIAQINAIDLSTGYILGGEWLHDTVFPEAINSIESAADDAEVAAVLESVYATTAESSDAACLASYINYVKEDYVGPYYGYFNAEGLSEVAYAEVLAILDGYSARIDSLVFEDIWDGDGNWIGDFINDVVFNELYEIESDLMAVLYQEIIGYVNPQDYLINLDNLYNCVNFYIGYISWYRVSSYSQQSVVDAKAEIDGIDSDLYLYNEAKEAWLADYDCDIEHYDYGDGGIEEAYSINGALLLTRFAEGRAALEAVTLQEYVENAYVFNNVWDYAWSLISDVFRDDTIGAFASEKLDSLGWFTSIFTGLEFDDSLDGIIADLATDFAAATTYTEFYATSEYYYYQLYLPLSEAINNGGITNLADFKEYLLNDTYGFVKADDGDYYSYDGGYYFISYDFAKLDAAFTARDAAITNADNVRAALDAVSEFWASIEDVNSDRHYVEVAYYAVNDGIYYAQKLYLYNDNALSSENRLIDYYFLYSYISEPRWKLESLYNGYGGGFKFSNIAKFEAIKATAEARVAEYVAWLASDYTVLPPAIEDFVVRNAIAVEIWEAYLAAESETGFDYDELSETEQATYDVLYYAFDDMLWFLEEGRYYYAEDGTLEGLIALANARANDLLAWIDDRTVPADLQGEVHQKVTVIELKQSFDDVLDSYDYDDYADGEDWSEDNDKVDSAYRDAWNLIYNSIHEYEYSYDDGTGKLEAIEARINLYLGQFASWIDGDGGYDPDVIPAFVTEFRTKLRYFDNLGDDYHSDLDDLRGDEEVWFDDYVDEVTDFMLETIHELEEDIYDSIDIGDFATADLQIALYEQYTADVLAYIDSNYESPIPQWVLDFRAANEATGDMIAYIALVFEYNGFDLEDFDEILESMTLQGIQTVFEFLNVFEVRTEGLAYADDIDEEIAELYTLIEEFFDFLGFEYDPALIYEGIEG